MPDSGSTATEQGVQPSFRKFSFFNYLLLAALVLAGHGSFALIANRSDRPPAALPVRFAPLTLDPDAFATLTLVGAWRVEIDDARFGGVSAMSVDGERLMALTDSGTIVSLPQPGQKGRAVLRDLPEGPGSPRFKYNRDSEALVRDSARRGWWVAFEQAHQLWLYDKNFRRVVSRIDLGRDDWRANNGVEAAVQVEGAVLLFTESGDQALELGPGGLGIRKLQNRFGRVSDAARLADGRILLVGRRLRASGFENRLLALDVRGQVMVARSLASLGFRRLDNVEAIAAETRARGTRLWLMTDNDFRPRRETLLVALDLP